MSLQSKIKAKKCLKDTDIHMLIDMLSQFHIYSMCNIYKIFYYSAFQNRLEHTIANLDNVVENTTAAESQIRDTDMATEMVKYSNNNILA